MEEQSYCKLRPAISSYMWAETKKEALKACFVARNVSHLTFRIMGGYFFNPIKQLRILRFKKL